MAAAHGYEDGEIISLELIVIIARRICQTVDLPVTVDAEGGYAESAPEVVTNIQKIIDAGAAGINFEDQIVNGSGLYDIATQCKRIAAIRKSAEGQGVPLFVNARTDLFLHASSSAEHRKLMHDAKTRAVAYADAGASGFFALGLIDELLIAEICEHSRLPVNVMMKEGAPSISRLAELGVSRVSFGPSPYIQLMHARSEQATSLYSG